MTVQEAVRALEGAGWAVAGRPVAGAYVAEAVAGRRLVGVAAGTPEAAWAELWRWVASGRWWRGSDDED